MSDGVDLVSEKERFFRTFQVWPITQRFDPGLWMQNFRTSELVFAKRLIDRFCYFPELMVDALLKASIQRFMNATYATFQADHSNCVFINVEGENPNPTDSGYSFLRKVRDNLGVSERRIMSPQSALEAISANKTFVFVDDFVGSGQQMKTTWERVRILTDGSALSFKSLASLGTHNFAYCPCICTEHGLAQLANYAPELKVVPAHIIARRHSATEEDSLVWEGLNANEALDFLKQAAARAGFTAEDGGLNDWRGFHKRGLSVALHASIPDACLPIYYSQRNDWKPLMRRHS
jgi:hypothetical protein